MATILSGDIGLQANISAEFGHHVATLDTTAVHTSESRRPTAQDHSLLEPSLTALNSNINPRMLDYMQYRWFGDQYITNDYVQTTSGYVKPSTYNQLQPFEVGERNTNEGDTNHSFFFDFADYIGLAGTATITGTITHTVSGTVTMNFSAGGSASGFTISSGTQTFSQQVDIGSGGLDSGILKVSIDGDGGASGSGGGRAEISDLKCSITVTGRTRINGNSVFVNDYTHFEDLVGTGVQSTRDHALRFSNWDSGSNIAGNPVVHGVVTQFGILDQIYPDAGSDTEPLAGSFTTQQELSSENTAVPANASVVIRHGGSDLYSSETDNKFGIGAAPTNTDSGSFPGRTAYDCLQDLPAIVNHVALNDGSMSLSDTANLDIELRYIFPPQESADPRGNDDGFQPGFVKARLLLNPPFVSEDINLASSFTSTQTGHRRVKDPNVIDMDPTFTANFRGGIRQEGVANLTANFSVPLTQSGIGMILFTDPRRQTFEFFPGPGQIGPTGRIENRLHDDIRDASGSPIAPGLTIVRSPAIDPDLLFEATLTTSVKMIRGEAINLQVSLGQELDPTATGVIISNAETETFEFSLAVTAVLAIETDRFRELLLPAQTRKYNIMQETRDYAINTDTRKYPVPAETRHEAVDTESRSLKQKGYN